MLILAAPRATLRRGVASLCLCALFGAVSAARADELSQRLESSVLKEVSELHVRACI